MVKWVGVGFHRVVSARIWEGHLKITARSNQRKTRENCLFFSTLMFSLDVYDCLKHTYSPARLFNIKCYSRYLHYRCYIIFITMFMSSDLHLKDDFHINSPSIITADKRYLTAGWVQSLLVPAGMIDQIDR